MGSMMGSYEEVKSHSSGTDRNKTTELQNSFLEKPLSWKIALSIPSYKKPKHRRGIWPLRSVLFPADESAACFTRLLPDMLIRVEKRQRCRIASASLQVKGLMHSEASRTVSFQESETGPTTPPPPSLRRLLTKTKIPVYVRLSSWATF